MPEKYHPASEPMNGPNRLFLDRTEAAKLYDKTDWPGGSSFYPDHLNQVFRDMSDIVVEPVAENEQSELPFLPAE